MASGDSLLYFDPLANRPPASAFATLDLRGAFVALEFDASANESASFYAAVPRHYRGGDVIAVLYGTSAGTSGNAKVRVALTRLAAGSTLDPPPATSDSEDLTIAAPGAAGQLVLAATAALTVASLAASDVLLCTVTRLATDAADTLASDWELVGLEIREQ